MAPKKQALVAAQAAAKRTAALEVPAALESRVRQALKVMVSW